MLETKWSKWCGWGWVAERGDKLQGGSHGMVTGGSLGHAAVGGEEFHSTANAGGIRLGHMDGVAPVVIGCISNVPPIYTMGGPCLALLGGFMEDNFGA